MEQQKTKPQRSSKSTENKSHSTLNSDSRATTVLAGGPLVVNMKTIMAANTIIPQKQKKEISWTNILIGTKNTNMVESQDPILFSDLVKKAKAGSQEVQFSKKFSGPAIKDVPLTEMARKPGHVPVLQHFHVESHRERRGSDDDGLEDEDLTASDGIIRRPKVSERRASRRRSYIYEAIKMVKGEFTFNHRTYRPKVQVAYRVPPGQVPQAVVIERLHRLYKKTDINMVCQSLGIELSDLIPPPHYGEGNERYFQESMFRNRTRVSGQDKREYIRTGGKADQEQHAEDHFHRPNEDNSEEESLSTSSESESGENEEDIQSQHPFAKSKPPFGPQFPLDFFDNEEYDIRSGEDWIKLGTDSKGRKQSPIPGKAFLPMPMSEFRRLLPALSEVTHVNLLTKSEILDNFRRWLLKERYLRKSGPDARYSMAPTEAEMTFLARSTTTVGVVIPLDTGSSDDDVEPVKKVTSSDDSELSDRRPEFADEMEGEGTGGSEGSGSMSVTTVDDGLDEIMKAFKNIKKKKEITPEAMAQLEGPIKSESILSDIFSDPNSLVMTPEAVSATATAQLLGARFGELEESQMELDVMMGAEHGHGHGHGHHPGSPDFDPYEEDGFETLIFEYDKMKKVHNYDWRWVDVAAFEYDPVTRRYFVRSIFPPFVYAWVNKLYVLMDGEDPSQHGARLKDAIIRRIEFEYQMRYNLYLDCLPIGITTPNMSPKLLETILLKTLSTPRLRRAKGILRKVEKEIVLEYQRTWMKLYFDHVVEKHPKLYRPWVVLHEDHQNNDWEVQPSTFWQSVVERYNECKTCNFAYKVTRVQRASVLYKIEPFTALKEIVASCWEARKRPFLLVHQTESLAVDEYEFRQKEQMKEVQEYLKNEWMEAVLSSIRIHLEKIPRSWYNIDENRWDVFSMSKVSKYLTVVRFLMEDTLAYMVEESLKNFVEEFEVLTDGCRIQKGYEWQNDLKTSDFPPPEGMTPPFRLDLIMDKQGPKYSQLLGRYPKSMTMLFYSCIESASGIPDIVPLIMKNLLFGTARFLHSVEKQDPAMIHLKKDMQRYLQRGLLPVDVYAQKYNYYLPVWNLDLIEFMKEWDEIEHTTKEIKHTVDFHIKHMKEIDGEIPLVIDIGACRINVEFVKTTLIKKKKTLYMAILDSFSTKLRNQVLQIRDDYADIERKLTTRSDDIEEVMELKAYVETIPVTLLQKEELIQKILKDYELFERFKYPISLEDTDAKWTTALGTNRLTRISEDSSVWLDDDYDRLLKVQQQDLSALSDAVDSATLSVAGLVAFIELEKANEVSQEVRKIWKLVKDLQEHSDLLNKRQKIFGLPPAQNEALIRLGKDIEPFKNLWFTAADWNRIQDNCFKETLDKVDIDAVVKMISEGGKTIRRCVKYFTGSDAIQHIAEEVRHQIQEFKPLVPLIRTLKNPGMRQRHWEAISEICGFTVVAKGNQSFKKLLDQGISEHIEEIAKVGERATSEAQIESSMDKMQKEINNFKIKVSTDPDTGVQVIILPEGVLKVIDAYIKDTDDILQSPYRAPFEERVGIWEKRIKQTKENLENWLDAQDEWLDIQESFKIPDVATKVPNEHKLFLKMERIWRRVLRLVRDMPDVLDIGSDTTLRASIFQFAGIIVKARKGLEEFMKPSNSDSDEDIHKAGEGTPPTTDAPAPEDTAPAPGTAPATAPGTVPGTAPGTAPETAPGTALPTPTATAIDLLSQLKS